MWPTPFFPRHLHDWRETLLAKGNVARDVRQKAERSRLVFEGTEARFWGDITARKVELYLASIREGGVLDRGLDS